MKRLHNSAGRVVNIGGRSRSRGIRNTGYSLNTKDNSGTAPIPQEQMDWDNLRRSKLKFCTECELFDPLKGGCYKPLLPDRCEINKTGVMSNENK